MIQAVAKAAASMFSSRPGTCAIYYYVELFCLHGSYTIITIITLSVVHRFLSVLNNANNVYAEKVRVSYVSSKWRHY